MNVYGTFEEVNFAISSLIQRLEKEEVKLPYLLKFYKNNFKIMNTKEEITKRFNNENNLNEEQINILKKAILSD
ncbi:MAG: hypothetical protein HFJ54_04700 [Clostridia bacterium]|nr:hypothetical protein [Clostridia bacterium]